MDIQPKSAPLSLLIGSTASETLGRLRSMVDGSDEFELAHSVPLNAPSFEIVYRGVSLQLVVNEQVPELAGLKKIFCNLDSTTMRSSIDIGLGEHVAGGERVPAIIQGLLNAAQKLGSSLDAVGAVWHPAQIVSGFAYFSESIADYLAGGAFPVLALVNFKAKADGAINSKGLSFLAGQELWIVPNDINQTALVGRLMRVAHDIATNGPVLEAVKLDALARDEFFELQPLPEAGLLVMTQAKTSVAAHSA